MSETDNKDWAPITTRMERRLRASGRKFSIIGEMERWQTRHDSRLPRSPGQTAVDSVVSIRQEHDGGTEDISA